MNEELIIFDCDGTLVDTEVLNCHAGAKIIIDAGIEYCDTQYIIDNYKGMTLEIILNILAKKHSVKFPCNYSEIFLDNVREARYLYQNNIPNVFETLDSITSNSNVKISVASNGEPENVIKLT